MFLLPRALVNVVSNPAAFIVDMVALEVGGVKEKTSERKRNKWEEEKKEDVRGENVKEVNENNLDEIKGL